MFSQKQDLIEYKLGMCNQMVIQDQVCLKF